MRWTELVVKKLTDNGSFASSTGAQKQYSVGRLGRQPIVGAVRAVWRLGRVITSGELGTSSCQPGRGSVHSGTGGSRGTRAAACHYSMVKWWRFETRQIAAQVKLFRLIKTFGFQLEESSLVLQYFSGSIKTKSHFCKYRTKKSAIYYCAILQWWKLVLPFVSGCSSSREDYHRTSEASALLSS